MSQREIRRLQLSRLNNRLRIRLEYHCHPTATCGLWSIDARIGACDADSGSDYSGIGGAGTNIYCKGGVDTPHTGVDTMFQALRCNKLGHMKGECPENKKEKHKKIHKFKKPKAMVATWSDEDSSEKEEEEKSSSSDSEEICFMANSSDGKKDKFCLSGHFHYARVYVSAKYQEMNMQLSTRRPSSTIEYGRLSTSSLLHSIPVLLLSFLTLHLVSMAHKQAPRRGARSRATARPIPADNDPPTERRTKRRHDPAEQPGPSSISPSSTKRGRASSSGRGRGSAYPRRKILVSSPEVSEQSSSSSSESSQPSKATPTKPLSAGKTILKSRAVDLEDSELNAAFPEVINFFNDDGYKSKVKGIEIDLPTDPAATIFKIPDEGADYHNFEFNLHEAYTILIGLIVGDQVRRGPVVVEAPVVQEDQPQVQEDQPPVQEGQPPVNEDQPPVNEDQPHVADEVDVPLNAPLSPQLQPSSSLNPDIEIPSFSPQPQVQASTSFGGPFVPPELYTFLNDKFDALNTSIQTMSENFELRVQRLENTMSAKFIEQKTASDHAVQRFNRLIGTLGDASIELKEHQKELETVLKGILANSQADVFNTKETLSQISKT
ncbi:hypothetical protein Taro_008268 [Colocasia esculenta]|uniref:Uncharacterized protein n=1 Tax=Colocasia esculenta TaxID=4460 RepID=A0A843TXS5_COLES|nr:hypothetical protein [Colocasia esculenta]